MDIFNKSATFLKISLTKAGTFLKRSSTKGAILLVKSPLGQHFIKTTVKPNVEGK
jgi:hypothetical protein